MPTPTSEKILVTMALREDRSPITNQARAHDIIAQTGVKAAFYGKPYGNAFETALDRLPGIPRHRIAMVGDTLHTDVLGGAAAGIGTILVTDHGLFRGHDVAPFIGKSAIRPDWIVKTT